MNAGRFRRAYRRFRSSCAACCGETDKFAIAQFFGAIIGDVHVDLLARFTVKSVCEHLHGPRLAFRCEVKQFLCAFSQLNAVILRNCSPQDTEKRAGFRPAFRIAGLALLPLACMWRSRHYRALGSADSRLYHFDTKFCPSVKFVNRSARSGLR